jgi:hypothetical protein
VIPSAARTRTDAGKRLRRGVFRGALAKLIEEAANGIAVIQMLCPSTTTTTKALWNFRAEIRIGVVTGSLPG